MWPIPQGPTTRLAKWLQLGDQWSPLISNCAVELAIILGELTSIRWCQSCCSSLNSRSCCSSRMPCWPSTNHFQFCLSVSRTLRHWKSKTKIRDKSLASSCKLQFYTLLGSNSWEKMCKQTIDFYIMGKFCCSTFPWDCHFTCIVGGLPKGPCALRPKSMGTQ